MSNQTIIENFSEQLQNAGYRSGITDQGKKLTANGNGHPRPRKNRIEIEISTGATIVKVAWSTPENARLTFETVPTDQVIPLLKKQGFLD